MPKRTEKPEDKAPEKTSALHREVKCLVAAAVGIIFLLVIFLPNDDPGFIIRFFHGFLFGFFGYGAFILPIGVVAVAVCKLVARDLRLPLVKMIAVFWLVLSILHILINEEPASFNFIEVFSEGRYSGGGIMGLILGGAIWGLTRSNAVALFALVSAILILLVLITKKSFVQIVGKGVKKARNYYEESRDYENNKTGTVVINPGLRENPANKKSNIIEITPDENVTLEPPPRIHLINEDRDRQNREKQKQNPLFAPRPPITASRDEDYAAHEAAKRSAVITFPEPLNETFEPAEPYEDDYRQDYPEDEYYPEDELTDPYYYNDEENDEPIVLPLETRDYGPGPVVKGLVDGAAQSSELSPLFADDEDDLYEYDEFARASGMGGKGFSAAGVFGGLSGFDEDGEDSYDNGAETASRAGDKNFLLSLEDFQLPSLNLLTKNDRPVISAESRTQVLENSRILEETLRSFKIEAKVMEVSVGPTVTRYDLAPGPGVKVSSISNLSNDLALSLAAQGLRIEAPVPGKSAVGIEIPNKEPQGVFLREILEDDRFVNFPSRLAFAVGKDIAGSPIITDVARMPHLLIAGATGSGKSVCINTLITSLLYKARPDEVKLLMIDPKVVELSVYNGIPHLLIPVVTDPKKASGALNWAVAEMESRYAMFAEAACRDIKGYNKYMTQNGEAELPLIVIVIDELADLMMACKGEVEESICRLAQKARAAGIHLIVATQRPSVDVITGLIKANIPSRLAFAVSSGTDSRTVLDMYGAEKLLGKGDMLFLPMGQNKPIRVQGAFVSDTEVENLVNFLRAQAPVEHTVEEIQRVTMPGKAVIEGELDEFFHDAVDFLITKGKGSTSMLQRQFRIGYNRASRLMDDLEARGIVGPEDGVKPRKVTITREEYRELYG